MGKSTTECRYSTFHAWLKQVYGERVQKICIDAGFTCPNRDGSKGTGGCLFCDDGGSAASRGLAALSIREQVVRQMSSAHKRYGANKFIAYFQAFTNTHADVNTLRRKYNEALCDDRLIGLSVGARADCVTPDVCALLRSYTRTYHVWLELGLESSNQATLDRMNRAEHVEDFAAACAMAHDAELDVVAHVIFGLPGDTHDDCMNAVDMLNRCRVEGVKIHNLYIDDRAPIAEMWRRGEVRMLELDEYVRWVCDAIERLDPRILIHRLTGEAPGERLLAPQWVRDKSSVLSAAGRELEWRGARQGILFRG